MNRILQFTIFMFWGTLLYSQNRVVDGVTFSADGSTLIKYPKDKTDEEYVVPEGTKVIVSYAIGRNEHLRKITLPSSLMEMKMHAIMDCSRLETVIWNTYPQRVTNPIISDCPIKEFQTSKTCLNCITIDGVLFSTDKKNLFISPSYNSLEPQNSYMIPEEVEVISGSAFMGAYINEIILPSTLKEIGDYAFSECRATSVTWKKFPDNRGFRIFNGSRISSFKVLGNDCNCISIDGVLYSKDQKRLLLIPACKTYDTVPEGVEEIGTNVFEGIGSEKITLPTTLTHINDSAFYDGPSHFVITGKFPIIGNYAWDSRRCFEVSEDNPYCQVSEDGFVYSKDRKTLHVAFGNGVENMSNVEIIDRYAFQNCLLYSWHINIPSSVYLIREHAFDDIYVPIPTCSRSSYNLNFSCDALTPPELEGEVFTEDNVGYSTLFVPKGCEELYKATPQWNAFGTIATPRPPQGVSEISASTLKINQVGGTIYIEALKSIETVRLISLNGSIVYEESKVNSNDTTCKTSSLDRFTGLLQVIYKDGDREVIKLNF